MLKKLIFSLMAFATITLTGCDKIKDAISDVSITPTVSAGSFDVPAAAAGATPAKETTVSSADITAALKTAGASTKQVKAVTVTGFELTIPASATWDFSALESATVSVDGTVVGTLPAGATGKVATFAAPATQADLKAAFLNGNGFKISFSGKTKSATTAATLTGKIFTKLTFNLGL